MAAHYCASNPMVTYFRVYLFLRMRVKSQKLVLANNWPPSCSMYPDRHFAKNYTSKMYNNYIARVHLLYTHY